MYNMHLQSHNCIHINIFMQMSLYLKSIDPQLKIIIRNEKIYTYENALIVTNREFALVIVFFMNFIKFSN